MAAKSLAVYFFPGPEIGKKRMRIEAIEAAITAADSEKPEKHRFYPYDTDIGDIISLLRNGSLFSSRRLVIVADAHALKASDIKLFKEYISAPSPDAVLIFTSDETPGTREYPRTLADALPKDAVQVFWELFERDKRSWVMGFFRERNLRVDADAVDLLLDVTQGTTDALREACEMLSFSAGSGASITQDDVDKALEHGRTETVYSLFDRFCRRDLSAVLEAYRKIVHSDPSAADRLLSMLVDPLVRLRDFSALVKRGSTIEAAASQLRLRGGKRALRAYSEGIHHFSEGELDTAVSGIADLEAWLRMAPRDLRGPKTELWFCRVIGMAL